MAGENVFLTSLNEIAEPGLSHPKDYTTGVKLCRLSRVADTK